MSELRECPICETDQYVYVIPFGGESDKLICTCNVCGASTGACDTEEKAKRQWNILVGNRRAQPDNPPLSLEQLRQMDGEPVWIEFFTQNAKNGKFAGWTIVDNRFESQEFMNEHHLKFSFYGKSWLAYEHKPEKDSDEG